MRILSIQSSVAYGHVGNSAAVFPLQRLGHEVWPVLTVHFSNHTGYGAWRGPLLAPEDVREVIAGLGDRDVLRTADAVLSGYQGDPAMGAVILDAVAQVKALNPAAVYCCDPVIGDVGRGVFVRPGDPGVHPGRGRTARRRRDAQPLRAGLPHRPRQRPLRRRCWQPSTSSGARGPRDVLVTSVRYPGAVDTLDVVAVSDEGAWSVTTPLLPISPNGGGDLTAALYLAHLLETGRPRPLWSARPAPCSPYSRRRCRPEPASSP